MSDSNPRGSSSPGSLLVYIGCYTHGSGDGILQFQMDTSSGRLTRVGAGAACEDASFLALSPDGRFLYAVSEVNHGSVSAYAIGPGDHDLRFLSRAASGGSGPCHLSVDRAGRTVLVANYNSGSVASLPVGPDGGVREAASVIQHRGSSADPGRQEGPHAHCIMLDAANRFAFAVDLGLDQILTYRFDSEHSTLTPADPPFTAVQPGSGPRHFAFHPGGQYGYVINELNSTVTAFAYDAPRGSLHTLQTVSTLPPGFTGTNYPAEVKVSPNGLFLYGSNRGHDSIVVYRIDAETGLLTLVQHQPSGGQNPRSFSLDPNGEWLIGAHQDSGNLAVLRVHPGTGMLSPTGESMQAGKPVCVLFGP